MTTMRSNKHINNITEHKHNSTVALGSKVLTTIPIGKSQTHLFPSDQDAQIENEITEKNKLR